MLDGSIGNIFDKIRSKVRSSENFDMETERQAWLRATTEERELYARLVRIPDNLWKLFETPTEIRLIATIIDGPVVELRAQSAQMGVAFIPGSVEVYINQQHIDGPYQDLLEYFFWTLYQELERKVVASQRADEARRRAEEISKREREEAKRAALRRNLIGQLPR